jgi:hypothetical protein
MPAQYLAIKASLKKSGKSDKEAKRIAAATYNKQHPGHPMHGHRRKKRTVPKTDSHGYY